MGQYYMPTIIDAEGNVKTVYSHDFDNGLKLMEHSWIGSSFVNAVISLIHNNPCRIAWIGDYSHKYCDDAYEKIPFDEFITYYKIAWTEEDECKIPAYSFSDNDKSIVNDDTKGFYFINHTQKTYIDIGTYIETNICKQGDWEGYCINPLPLLTACGNGRGGGDYNYHARIGIEDVGTWAFDLIEYSDNVPEGYESVMYEFREWD